MPVGVTHEAMVLSGDACYVEMSFFRTRHSREREREKTDSEENQ